jgi:putative membrane protein
MTDTPAARHEPVAADSAPLPEGPPAEAPPVEAAPVQTPARDPLRNTRASRTWVGLIAFAILLVLTLIFILQNTQSVQISYLGASGQLPLAVAMLLAAVAGILLAAIAGSLRIWQLRRNLRRATRQ